MNMYNDKNMTMKWHVTICEGGDKWPNDINDMLWKQ